MTDSTGPTRLLHSTYLQLSGLSIPFTMPLHYRLEQFIASGGNSEDLALVIGYIKRRIREKKRERESLLPRNLFSDYSNFLEDLSMARSEARTPKTDPARDGVLAVTGRTAAAETKAVTAGDVLANAKAFEAFRAWRQEAGI